MSAIITNSLDGFLRATNLTGNAFIDSLILASIVPIIIAYVNGLFTFIKALFEYIFKTIYAYTEDKIKTKFMGRIICSISISEDNRLFSHMKEIIFNEDIKSDITDNIFKRICALGNKNEENKYENHKYVDKFKISLDYSGDKLFVLNKNYSTTNIETKIFTHKNFYVKIALQNDGIKTDDKTPSANSIGNQITIELIAINTLSSSSNDYEYANEIETFLLERFKLNKLINYLYTIKIVDNTMSSHIGNFLTKGLNNSSNGSLKYGDGEFDYGVSDIDTDNKNSPFSLLVDVKNRNLSANKNSLKDNFILINNGNDNSGKLNGFYSLYHKFISKNLPILNSYGYYFDNNKLILIHNINVHSGAHGYNIYVISLKTLLKEDDIKHILEYIISVGMSASKPLLTNNNQKNNMNVYKYTGNQWYAYSLDRRTFNSIFIHNETMNEIKKEIENFIRVEKLYYECNIPYRKGILLYGPPGTGKTSLVKAIAYEYQMNVYMVNINDTSINDDSITDMLNSIGGSGNRILLFEDIDSAFSEKEEIKFGKKNENMIMNYDHDKDNCDKDNDNNNKKQNPQLNVIGNNTKTKYLTYSGLINALDGVLSNQHGVITIMTTNYLNKLGDALIRPGRIDHKYNLGPCDYDQIVHMTKYIIKKSIDLIKSNNLENIKIENNYEDDELYSKIDEFANKLVNDNKLSKIKPCKLQQYILKNIENIDLIFNNWSELLNE